MLPLALLAVVIVQSAPATEAQAEGARGRWHRLQLTGRCGGATVDVQGSVAVYVPRAAAGGRRLPLLIALHGWGHRAADWRKTPIEPLAERLGLVVAAPEMGKTVYESRTWPESRPVTGPVPGACWVGEVVLPAVRSKFPVAAGRAQTAIVGYSTGGRGALVVAERYPEFAFAGSLSGTYDLGALQPGTGEYRIHAKLLGERATFPERWRAEDVIGDDRREALGAMTLWLAHGANDAVVPPAQLARMQEFLSGFHRRFEAVTVKGAGHDFAFWGGQLPAMLEAAADAMSP